MFDDGPLRVNEAGAERDESRFSTANAEAKQRRARITSQFRERRNMAYERNAAHRAHSLRPPCS
jgi:hypothetical protein